MINRFHPTQKARFLLWGLVILCSAGVLLLPTKNNAVSMGVLERPILAPEFTHQQPSEWLNSAPLKLADLRGEVILLDFWTFGCWNCYRSFPWLRSVERRFEDKGLQVIGVHSPEFDHERDIDNVRKKIEEFQLHHPVMIDNDFSYWKAMRNKYWPAFYVIDKKGKIRGVFVGEIHEGDQRAARVEKLLIKLLARS